MNGQAPAWQQPSGTDRLQALYAQSPQLETYLKHLESEARRPLLAKVNILSEELNNAKKGGTPQWPQSGDDQQKGKDKPLTLWDLDAYFNNRQNAEKESAESQRVEQEKGAFVQKFPEAIPHLEVLPNIRKMLGLSYEWAWKFFQNNILPQWNIQGVPAWSQASNTNTSTAWAGGVPGAKGPSRDDAEKVFWAKYL